MSNWNEIIEKKFGVKEKRVDIAEGLFIMVKKIDALRKKQLTNLVGQIITSTTDPTNPDRPIMVTQFTQEYQEQLKEHWKILFEYGIDKNYHNIESAEGKKEVLDLAYWEKMAKEYPAYFERVEMEIRIFNNLIIMDNAETKKK
jgi:hypothetical protein